MIKLNGIKKSFGGLNVYDGFDMDIEDGKVTVVLGPSGCGKTTLLKILAGIVPLDGGTVEGAVRPAAFVFQEDRLLPNMTVVQNLRFTSPAGADIEGALKRAELGAFADYYPAQLSGGMARRVSLLRAFLFNANLMLLDEPFRNLDLKLKFSLMDFYKELVSAHPVTSLLVTHDIDEALYLGDRIAVLQKGKIILDTAGGEENRDKLKAALLK